ncbi:hypothetical protein HZS_2639 [Henneguya salminicola]|nr:hypothetical protein HZS_2639 [Henneguya salminicola]
MKSNSSNTCTLTEILEYNYENIKNITDKSLFLQTCMENYYGAVQEFLEIDPEIILIRINNIYPLEFVCLRNNKLMAKILCEHLKRNKYIFDFNLCLQICKFKKFICLFEIILFYINYHGLTILHLAIILQKLKPIRLLLKFGASVTDVTRVYKYSIHELLIR